MRKNGFTLIELLAVIVILAIIALIATPIILGIINDAREKANERSVELYASAIKNGIAAYQLREMKEVAVGTYTTETLPFDVEYDGEVECTTIELYDNGGVYVAGCTVNDTEVDYTYGTKGVFKGKMSSVCNPISVQTEGTYTAGDKYECDVDPNKEGYDQIFYVLTTPATGATSVNLIMDSNINISGNAVKGEESDLGRLPWHVDGDNSYGPITAMNFLTEATEGWTNTNELKINTFTDEEGNTHPMTEYVVNARMPYYSEISNYSADANNAYLYNNLYLECWDEDWNEEIACSDALDENKVGVNVEGIGHTSVVGYWTLSSYASDSSDAWGVTYRGLVVNYNVSIIYDTGVRPVINLSI